MRVKVFCEMKRESYIPFNYNYQLQSVIYDLIRKSSPEFSLFLHSIGFVEENRQFRLFTFSKLFFNNCHISERGFDSVRAFYFFFSTPILRSYEHLVLGIFANQQFSLRFSESERYEVTITQVESLPETVIGNEMKFVCLSPIASSTGMAVNDKIVQHYLDYMNPTEREQFTLNLKQNLIKKYRLVNKQEFDGNDDFTFSFDIDYILKQRGKIRKNIRFKIDSATGKYSHIIGMEAPFTIKADPKLISIGYQCGFGEKNSAGFGMVEAVR